MASARRNTIRINFVRVPSQLKDLVSKVPENSQFTKRHGRLLSLVTSGFEDDMMSVIFQFLDPAHHCFTFPDYHLIPIMEEFSKLLGIHVLDQTPFTSLEKDPQPEEIVEALRMKGPTLYLIRKQEVESRVFFLNFY